MFKNLITASINLHQLKLIISVFLSKFRYHVCIQPLTDEQLQTLQTLQTGLYNMICKKARMTRGRHIFINATNSHFGLNIPTLHEEQTLALLRMYERIQVRNVQNLNILHHEIAEIESLQIILLLIV